MDEGITIPNGTETLPFRITGDGSGPRVGGPRTFEDVFMALFDEAFDLLVERQRKYGPENIRRLGLFGVFGRLADDKLERIRRALNGRVVRGVVELDKRGADFDDESFEDALKDAANYCIIMLALWRGLWGYPLEAEVQEDVGGE